MPRRGLFAELLHQHKLAERDRARAAREAERAARAAAREAERRRKEEERAAAKLLLNIQAKKKQQEKEAKEAHVAAQLDEVEYLNAELEAYYAEIDSMLEATLDVDDYVDLESLRREVVHPPFDSGGLSQSLPEVVPLEPPPKPEYREPAPRGGLMRILGKRQHAMDVDEAKARYELLVAKWESDCRELAKRHEQALADRERAERERVTALELAQKDYRTACQQREEETRTHNESLDRLIANLGYGDVEAVQEYVGIVLSNSVYPETFAVEHSYEFEPATAELKLNVVVPPPDTVRTIKAYKYTKSTDQISSTQLSKKACKDRYAGAVSQIALRTLHEVFEADRRGIIKTISVQVGTECVSPATGLAGLMLFIAVSAERESFLKMDLARVVPSATLAHLGAAVSKNPYELVVVDPSGIRKS